MAYGSPKDAYAYTNNDEAKTRTALGPAAHYFPMYNDRPNAGLSAADAGDTRAQVGQGANWGNPLLANRMLWEDKFVGPKEYSRNPLSQVETKMGLTADQRDEVLREKEKAQTPAKPPPMAFALDQAEAWLAKTQLAKTPAAVVAARRDGVHCVAAQELEETEL